MALIQLITPQDITPLQTEAPQQRVITSSIWKQIRHLHFEDGYYDLLVHFIKTGIVPDIIDTVAKRRNFKRVGKLLSLDDSGDIVFRTDEPCLLYTSPSPRDGLLSRMPSSA